MGQITFDEHVAILINIWWGSIIRRQLKSSYLRHTEFSWRSFSIWWNSFNLSFNFFILFLNFSSQISHLRYNCAPQNYWQALHAPIFQRFFHMLLDPDQRHLFLVATWLVKSYMRLILKLSRLLLLKYLIFLKEVSQCCTVNHQLRQALWNFLNLSFSLLVLLS